MQDVLLDRLGSTRPARNLYFGIRNIALTVVIVSSALWFYTGWDGTIEQLFTGRYGEGIHWSTLQTFFLFFYILTLNMQTGGLNSVRELVGCVRQDLHAIVYGNHFQKNFEKIRDSYKPFVVDNLRGCVFAFFIVTLGLAIFENAWVPLYDYFQFGSWAWPIYSFTSPSWDPFAASLLARNVMVLTATSLSAPAIFYFGAWTWTNEHPKRRYSIQWRFDRFWAVILLPYALFLWLFWISGNFPHAIIGPSNLTIADVIKDKLPPNFTFSGTTWTFPRQVFFPQTSYTFYPANVYLKSYIDKQIYGFYVNDPFIHFLNIFTKYMTVAAVAYPAMLKVKVNQ